MEGTTLCFLNTEKIRKGRRYLRFESSYKNILLCLNRHLLLRKRDQCMYAYRHRRDEVLIRKQELSMTGKEYSRFQYRLNKVKKDSVISGLFVLSNKGAAKVFGKSAGSANKYLKDMERLGLIMYTKRRQSICGCTYQKSLSIRESMGIKNCFWSKGYLWLRMSSTISIIDTKWVKKEKGLTRSFLIRLIQEKNRAKNGTLSQAA